MQANKITNKKKPSDISHNILSDKATLTNSSAGKTQNPRNHPNKNLFPQKFSHQNAAQKRIKNKQPHRFFNQNHY